jgi:SAM-dependent methyltransferase
MTPGGNENVDATRATDGLRAGLRDMWSAVAPGWAEHADIVDGRSAELTARMLDAAALQPGERVLELACGPGGVGLAAARRAGPGGEVVVSDISAEMSEIAAARASASGLDNVTARVLELEAIDEPDASYDVALCREGLMFAPEPQRAADEIARVLRPGGRVALAVWGPRARNPWLGIVLDAVSAELGAPVPPPGIPGPFSLEDRDRLAALLRGAGLTDVAVEEQEMAMGAESFDAWWTRTCALAGPLSRILDALDEDKVAAVRERARAAVAELQPGGDTSREIVLGGVTFVASARRP